MYILDRWLGDLWILGMANAAVALLQGARLVRIVTQQRAAERALRMRLALSRQGGVING